MDAGAKPRCGGCVSNPEPVSGSPPMPTQESAGPAACAQLLRLQQILMTTREERRRVHWRRNPLLPIQHSQPPLSWTRQIRCLPPCRCRPRQSAYAGHRGATCCQRSTCNKGSRGDQISAGQGRTTADYRCEQFRNLPAAHHEDQRCTHHVEAVIAGRREVVRDCASSSQPTLKLSDQRNRSAEFCVYKTIDSHYIK